MTLSFLTMALAGLTLAATVRAAGSFRFATLIKAYAVSAGALGLLAVTLGVARHEPHLYPVAAFSIILKAFVIPLALSHVARRSGMNMRLTSFLRPATTYFVVLGLVIAVAIAAVKSPFAAGADPEYLLIVGLAMVIIGFAMMIMRRDLLSQVTGFLVMENGISAFSFAIIHDLPFLVELGILTTLTAGVVLMGVVSERVRELNGTESTQELKELTD